MIKRIFRTRSLEVQTVIAVRAFFSYIYGKNYSQITQQCLAVAVQAFVACYYWLALRCQIRLTLC
jgi:hypothetical protein